MSNQVVKEQFNKQAENFANWSVGKNEEYLNGYFDFCDIQKNDNLLDVACGPGKFAIFISKRISETRGIDISEKEIEIANQLAEKFGLTNVKFNCNDVENLPYRDDSFSIVVCKSAFHHFKNPKKVFQEMIRCCNKGGKISIQDIRAYDNKYINDFFEQFDKLIDISHNKTLTELEFNQLYLDKHITKLRDFKLELDLNVREYIGHAIQDLPNKSKIEELLKIGLDDKQLGDFLFEKNGELYFKRPVYLIIGTK